MTRPAAIVLLPNCGHAIERDGSAKFDVEEPDLHCNFSAPRRHTICGSQNGTLWNISPEDLAYSALMLAARITLPHFSVSSAMSLPNSAGEPASVVLP